MTKVSFVKAYQDTGRVQGDFLAQAIQMEIEELERDGYDVQHIVPVVSGHVEDASGNPPGEGYTFTSGVIVIAKK